MRSARTPAGNGIKRTQRYPAIMSHVQFLAACNA